MVECRTLMKNSEKCSSLNCKAKPPPELSYQKEKRENPFVGLFLFSSAAGTVYIYFLCRSIRPASWLCAKPAATLSPQPSDLGMEIKSRR